MRPVFLIAGNYMREQRWLILLLLAWVFASSVVLGLDGNASLDDAVFFLRQQAVYGVAFGGFLSASAIYNERRSRRMLCVLAKAIERRQYLAGLLCGVGGIELLYAAAMQAGGIWMLHSVMTPARGLPWLILSIFLAAMLVAAIALFFSTFLNPLVALAATALTTAVPPAAGLAIGRAGSAAVPAYSLVVYVMSAPPRALAAPDWRLLLLAAAETVLFWLAAALVFSFRDIAAAVE